MAIIFIQRPKKKFKSRLEEMLSHSEYELFFTALKFEYRYNAQKDLDQAFLLYKETVFIYPFIF
jgi:hypothetical protein